VVSIAGDSGSGKSTLIKSLEHLFLFDNYIVLETDRYHKWERGSEHWNSYTHLNPDANHLEKMSEDIFRLKLGENIFAVDYNHSTGKFTEKQKIEAKPYILLCGLHTLYKDNIRNLSEIKIFLDTEKELKTEWKIQRDVIERNKSKEEVIQNIKHRENDYYKYIEPQKYHSDIIIEYVNKDKLELNIYINDTLNYYTNTFLSQISKIHYKENNFNKYIINKDKININIIKLFINNSTILNKLSEYPFNIIQTIVYLCLFKE
jgi:uridine kinase